MTRGVLATADRAERDAGSAPQPAAALEVLDLPCALRLPRRMTARARGWAVRAREDRIGVPVAQVEHDRPLFALLYRLSRRARTWRHPTADGQAGAVVACLAAIPPR